MRFFLLIIFFICTNANSIGLKLTCNITSKYFYTTGQSENEKGFADIEISEYDEKKLITFTSAIDVVNNISVTTIKRDGRLVQDYSDSNKWDITNTVSGLVPKVNSSIIRVKIDRNTGSVIATNQNNFIDNKSDSTYVSGICQKVDITKKKF